VLQCVLYYSTVQFLLTHPVVLESWRLMWCYGRVMRTCDMKNEKSKIHNSTISFNPFHNANAVHIAEYCFNVQSSRLLLKVECPVDMLYRLADWCCWSLAGIDWEIRCVQLAHTCLLNQYIRCSLTVFYTNSSLNHFTQRCKYKCLKCCTLLHLSFNHQYWHLHVC